MDVPRAYWNGRAAGQTTLPHGHQGAAGPNRDLRVLAMAELLEMSFAQYHLPRAKPPKAISPTKTMISPIQKLHTNIRTIPTITMMPPSDMPAIPRRSSDPATPSLLPVSLPVAPFLYPLRNWRNRGRAGSPVYCSLRDGVNVSSAARSWTLRSTSSRDGDAPPRGCRTIRTIWRTPPHRQRTTEAPLDGARPSL